MVRASSRAWFAVLALAACGEDGAFNDRELLAIRAKLAVVPETAPVDPTNKYAEDPRAAALGQKLYFEARYSSTGTVSCATCHDPDAGFQDPRANTSQGVAGFTARHAPIASYSALMEFPNNWSFWDGRADSLWSQALGPAENMVEMGSARTRIAYLLFDHYRTEYEAIFGPLPVMRDGLGADLFPPDAKPGTPAWAAISIADQDMITAAYVGFGKAVAAYEAMLLPHGSRFDAFLSEILAGASDSPHLDAQEKLGLKLFLGKGACLECHTGPALSDGKFHNIGVAQRGANVPADDRGRTQGIPDARTGEFSCSSKWSDLADKSACAIGGLVAMPGDLGAFKTPTLRDLTRSAPYMHTGALSTLDEVIEHYDLGGDASGFAGTVDDRVAPLDLTPAEKRALLAFLRTLDAEPLPSSLVSSQ